ncbi:MAG TPA: FtsQ-type POTRA domain-containing protein [Acidimicrobiales bacterium]|nr:FtsQ-type POTRA domain-containing protein [Acidimicrobiales bacterium]
MDRRIGQRRAAVIRARGRRRLKVVVGLLVVTALAVGAEALAHSAWLSARHLVVVGAVHTPPAEVLRAAGLSTHPPLAGLDPGAEAVAVQGLPWVERATVERRWPDTVVVDIVERVPVAAVPTARGGEFALVDASGRVVQWSMTAGPLPLLRSPAAPGRPGSTLGSGAGPGLATVSAAMAIVPGRVHGVAVAADGSVTLDLGSGIQVLVGADTGLTAKLDALASLLAGVAPTGPEVIDVRVPGEPTTSAVGTPGTG